MKNLKKNSNIYSKLIKDNFYKVNFKVLIFGNIFLEYSNKFNLELINTH